MKNKGLTITVVANMTSNYGESLGNIGSVQKVYIDGKAYSMKTRESLKQEIMKQSGMYDDLVVSKDGVTQKMVGESEVKGEKKLLSAATCRALEGGYMNTGDKKSGITRVRKSSIYLTDAISTTPMGNDYRFHNNLNLASTYAKQEGLNVQNDAKEVGLMPFQYEFDKGMKVYSLTIDLDRIGVDENFEDEASIEEKVERVERILSAVEELSLVVRGSLDNAEPIFVVGGISRRKTHYFENVVKVKDKGLIVTENLVDRAESEGYSVGFLEGGNFTNEEEIKERLKPISMKKFFNKLREDVKTYYGE